ncbi:MAG: hypothetical protein AVDCRST_MAG64-246 [uncultured Phycisphaerae bacterium]|uniref:Uncharacterized protein n=1 Tax=uncultured Phycisphaerae bacterium TaxID=904963 RepID=A0A6J4N4P5_9BACT|nr:MAG: hypothetical protein AVDCRST_MAG64-246 [uncultured Phycisphaerae bacterium]
MNGPGDANRLPGQPTFGTIGESDLGEVADFLARQARPGEASGTSRMSPERRLRWLLAENPARVDGVPFGWSVRDPAGRLVGTLLCVPLRVAVCGGVGAEGGDGRGEGVTCTALMSCKFFVDAPYRGAGLVPFRSYLRLAAAHPLFCTSANALSGELFTQAGGHAIAGTDHTMLGVRRPAPLAEEWARRRVGGAGRSAAAVARVLALPLRVVRRSVAPRRRPGERGGGLTLLNSVDDLSTFRLAPSTGAVTVVRDEPYLRWRYFSGESAAEVYRFQFAGEPDRLLVIDTLRAGYRSQIRVLNVLDLWPPAAPECAPALAAALAERFEPRFDAIWLRGQPTEAETVLKSAGWLRHDFPAPLGWCVDRHNVFPTRHWYLMPGQSE